MMGWVRLSWREGERFRVPDSERVLVIDATRRRSPSCLDIVVADLPCRISIAIAIALPHPTTLNPHTRTQSLSICVCVT